MLIRAQNGELVEKLDAHCTYRGEVRPLAVWSKGYFFVSMNTVLALLGQNL